MTMGMESVRHPIAGFREVMTSLSGINVVNAAIAFIFATSAPVAIIISVGLKGGLSQADIASWIFAAFFMNGIVSIVLTLLYRTPLVCFWTIPGTVLVGPALDHLSFPEVIGAYWATGLLLVLLGLSGSVRRVLSLVPMPIIMAMVAGVFLRFGLDWIGSLKSDFWIALPMTATFFVLSAFSALERRIPPMIGVLIVGVALIVMFGDGPSSSRSIEFSPAFGDILATPNVYVPVFSIQAMIELVVPLAITVVAAQNAQGIAILQSSGHEPPVNAVTVACGVGSLITAVFGCVSTCLTGPSNAILASAGERSSHYTAGIVLAILGMIFGLFSPFFTSLLLVTPPGFIATLAGLALLKVLKGAFEVSFQDRFTLGALVAFLVTVADHAIFNIGAPFWGLLFGFATSCLLERGHFSNDDDRRG